MELDFKEIPMGTDHPIEEKLKWAHILFEACSPRLLRDATLRQLMDEYQRSIGRNWAVMRQTGVVKECTLCALQDGGSCCGSGIENKFDVVNLLVNLLLGTELPRKPWDPTGCWFLGETGCLITARHVICVNFMCRRLYDRLNRESVRKVQQAMQEETELAFLLEEYIKAWLARNG